MDKARVQEKLNVYMDLLKNEENKLSKHVKALGGNRAQCDMLLVKAKASLT